MLTELYQFFLVTSLPPAICGDIHHIETLTLCYCLRMLYKFEALEKQNVKFFIKNGLYLKLNN
ncbi:hypothetical protein BpHYR1_039295 [Brachionus plicatilis]|uniref:Uncharacterized protein n=1 Tax=Brachionus plicatilis TaxID=10195 RepID=A0A3M7REM1_BRAPC|nr:hypothetical protein BpHYR1_039295 [Brachionus plicatilis]